jgi:hypothetical protein
VVVDGVRMGKGAGSMSRVVVAERQERVFTVYVVDLTEQAIPARNRDGPRAGCVYVGHTGCTHEERLAAHRAGGRTSSSKVRRYGLHLRPDLTHGVGPFATREEAVCGESELAADLRSRGYFVLCGEGVPSLHSHG